MTWEQKVDHAAVTLLVPASVVWVAVEVTAHPEVAGRYAGGVLELFGFLVAAYALQKKVAQVTDRPGLGDRVVGWLCRAWRRVKMTFGWKPEGRTVSLEATGTGVATASARLKVTPGPDASLDRRVEILEQELESIRSRIDDLEQEVREARTELAEEITDVKSDLRDVEEELEDLIHRLAVGSLHWEGTGLFWFAVGVVVATWPGVILGS